MMTMPPSNSEPLSGCATPTDRFSDDGAMTKSECHPDHPTLFVPDSWISADAGLCHGHAWLMGKTPRTLNGVERMDSAIPSHLPRTRCSPGRTEGGCILSIAVHNVPFFTRL